jgi:hypothetical protein
LHPPTVEVRYCEQKQWLGRSVSGPIVLTPGPRRNPWAGCTCHFGKRGYRRQR